MTGSQHEWQMEVAKGESEPAFPRLEMNRGTLRLQANQKNAHLDALI